MIASYNSDGTHVGLMYQGNITELRMTIFQDTSATSVLGATDLMHPVIKACYLSMM